MLLGVTMWELLTFGKKPYENVLARDVYALLERGDFTNLSRNCCTSRWCYN